MTTTMHNTNHTPQHHPLATELDGEEVNDDGVSDEGDHDPNTELKTREDEHVR